MAGSLKTLLAGIAVLVISTAIVSCQEGLNDSLIADPTVNGSTTLPNTPAVENTDQYLADAGTALEVSPEVPECDSPREKCGFQLYDQFTRRLVGDPIIYCRCQEGLECLYDKDVLGRKFYEYRCNGSVTTEEPGNVTTEEPVTEPRRPKHFCARGIFNYCGFQYYHNDTKVIYEEDYPCRCREGLECRVTADDRRQSVYELRCESVEETTEVPSATIYYMTWQRRNGEL